MIISGKFLKSGFLIFLSLTTLTYFYINRTTLNPHYGKVFYKLGLECQNKCSPNKQLSYFRKAVFYDPNLSAAYHQLGIIYGNKGQHEKEIESYKKAAQLNHADGEAYFKLGLYCFQKGELDYALRYLLQSNRYKPGSDDTFYYMARAYDKKGMYEEAVHHYVTALIISGSPRSLEIFEMIKSIFMLPDHREMVLIYLKARVWDNGLRDLWYKIDQYLKAD